jgi:HSP20 family molecular chaperone IbpA
MLGEIVQQIIEEGGLSEFVQSQPALQSIILTSGSSWKPQMDMLDNDSEICIYLSIPGVKNSSIDIDILNNRMMISGERDCPYTQSDYQVKRSEISYGRFQRVITLPIGVTNQGSVSTSIKDGVLLVKIDKRVEQQNRFSVRVPDGGELSSRVNSTESENNN